MMTRVLLALISLVAFATCIPMAPLDEMSPAVTPALGTKFALMAFSVLYGMVCEVFVFSGDRQLKGILVDCWAQLAFCIDVDS